MNKEKKLGVILVAIFAFFVGCLIMYAVIYSFPTILATTKIEKDVTVNENGIADAVEKVYDAVVVVNVYKNNVLAASGSGFTYKLENGNIYILTNNHVIEGGSKVTVTFTNGDVLETEVIGLNALADIAVLSVKANDKIVLSRIGSSNDARVGDTVFAIGAPLDKAYSWTVTRGVLSGKDRLVESKNTSQSTEYVMKVLQTDAAINNGNSGGPLCNSNGEVIGITSMKLVDTSVDGMGFAIPIETAVEYAEKIINKEEIAQPYLGVSMLNVSDAYYYAQYYSYLVRNNITSGIIIVEVESKSPAAKAGLKSGDIITKFNNNEVGTIGYLRYYLYNQNIGDKVHITYTRDGKEKSADITLVSK